MHSVEFRRCRQFLLIAVTSIAAKSAFAAKPTPPPPPPPPVHYDITWFDAGGPSDRFSIYSLNRQGTTAVGSRVTNGISQAVTIDIASGNVTDLNTVIPGIPSGWQLTSARNITDTGRVAGDAIDSTGTRAIYVYDPADATPFQPVGVGVGSNLRYRDMNDAGDLLYAEFSSSNSYLYKHDDHSTVALPSTLMQAGEMFYAGPMALNDDLVVAGNRTGLGSSAAYAYDVEGNATTDISKFFRAEAINNSGTIVGRGSLSSKGSPTETAMMFENGVKTPLVSNVSSEAFDINDAGQVTGQINATNRSIATAFLYDPVQGFWSLNDLIQDTAQDEAYWTNGVSYNAGISVGAVSEPLDGGYPVIVGDKSVLGSMFADGVERRLGFILTPTSGAMASALVAASVPEPHSFLLLAVSLLWLGHNRCRRPCQ